MTRIKYFITAVLLMAAVSINAQYNIYELYNPEEAKYSLDDLGSMWTFDDIPFERWEKEYNFKPTEEWLEDVQLSALQFGRGCSAAFVSEDGLIMTNHHCGRDNLHLVQKEGENLLRDGFLAKSKEEERRIQGTFVDQLLWIKDVTNEIYTAMAEGSDDDEKVRLKDEKIQEIQNKFNEEEGVVCRVITFYNGGKYKAYGYKRYNDVRLVMAPDFQIAATGWDWDNFTYPRYELDFMFYRVYDENGEPVKSSHYFKFSKKGAEEGEPIFTVGRPGSTHRLISVAEMEYLRDYDYRYLLSLFNELYDTYYELMKARPENESELLNHVMGLGNGRKLFAGRIHGLRDPYVMNKKLDFEKNLQESVDANPELKEKYGHVWDAIKTTIDELKSSAAEASGFAMRRFGQSLYYNVADELITYAEQKMLPDDEREEDYVNGNAEKHLVGLYPDNYDKELNDKLLRAHVNYIVSVLGKDHELVKELYGDYSNENFVAHLLDNSMISSPEKINEFVKKSPEEILNSKDPFIYFLRYTRKKLEDINAKRTEARNTLQVLNQMLGEINFAVHGDKISPDATSSLRISDGVIKGYEYNGTLAPGKTTFFGLYDRYYSFDQSTYPWGLHPRWLNPPKELDLRTPICFASTNDTVGGNSGSSIINTKGEVVGILHDGNLEGLVGDFIFLPETNRAVATDSYGLMEALRYIFKADKLVKELETGQEVE